MVETVNSRHLLAIQVSTSFLGIVSKLRDRIKPGFAEMFEPKKILKYSEQGFK